MNTKIESTMTAPAPSAVEHHGDAAVIHHDKPSEKAPTVTSGERLKKSEVKQLIDCEHTIQEGMTTFINVGTALTVIRDNRLYREHYHTFEEYSRVRWGFSKTHSNRLIAAASFAGEVIAPLGYADKVGEYTIRPLVGLPRFQARKAIEKAVEKVGGDATRLTAKDLTTTLREMGIAKPGAGPTKVESGQNVRSHVRVGVHKAAANLIRRDDVLEIIDLWASEHARSFRGEKEVVLDALKRQINDL